MTMTAGAPSYSRPEELANSLTHGVGAALAAAATAVMVTFAALRGDAWHVVGCAVFGGTLVVLYLASTLYHAVQSPRAKKVLRVLDHAAIFLLIGGSYTPFTLVNLRGAWGWSLFGVVWGLALLGVAIQTTPLKRWRVASVALCVIMGWTVVVAGNRLADSVETGGLILLVAGGLAYTGGIAFYAARKLPFHHALWHLFVLAGSAFHVAAVVLFVIP